MTEININFVQSRAIHVRQCHSHDFLVQFLLKFLDSQLVRAVRHGETEPTRHDAPVRGQPSALEKHGPHESLMVRRFPHVAERLKHEHVESATVISSHLPPIVLRHLTLAFTGANCLNITTWSKL